MQKEAFWLGVPCITMRDETEWVETVEAGWNLVVGANQKKLLDAVAIHIWPRSMPPLIFGDGDAASCIAHLLEEYVQHEKG
jgi:UDP-N-acetylglucosamine 2-epimerase